jgi:hypothetical protein
MSVIATEIKELDVVELTHDHEGYPKGAVGTVVSAHPEEDAYTVEITDVKGTTLDLIPARGDDLRPARL